MGGEGIPDPVAEAVAAWPVGDSAPPRPLATPPTGFLPPAAYVPTAFPTASSPTGYVPGPIPGPPAGYGSSFPSYGQGNYAPAAPPLPPIRQRTRSGLSVAALVSAIISVVPGWLCLFPIGPPAAGLAILFGIIGIVECRGQRIKGRAMAITGIILGVVSLAVWVTVFAWSIAAWIDGFGHLHPPPGMPPRTMPD